MVVSNIRLNFKHYIGDHFIDAFVGYEQSENNEHTMGASRLHFPTAETPELSQGGAAASDYDMDFSLLFLLAIESLKRIGSETSWASLMT